jgi:protein arginine kinase activator
MECQECQQRAATLHFTQVVNGQKVEIHVCEACAREQGYMTYPDESYSFHNLLAGLLNFDTSHMGNLGDVVKQSAELKCPNCELTYSEFQRVGKFGCEDCYDAFSKRLHPIIRRVQSGNTKHHGKIPERKGGDLHTKKKIEAYKLRLQQLIESEFFEEAAIVRDQIRELKKHHQESGDI